MWIRSKRGEALYNADAIANIYTTTAQGYSGVAVRVSFANQNKDLTIADYQSTELAHAAIRYIYEKIAQGVPVARMPSDEDTEMARREFEMKARSQTGKKPIRRGGS